MVSLSTLLKVLQALLQEQVPVRDIRTIAEAIANVAAKSQDPAAMVAAVRVALSRAIVQNVVGLEPELPVITLEPRLEQILLNSLQKANQGSDDGILLEPGMAEKLQRSPVEAAQRQEMLGKPAILLVAGPVRAMLSRFARGGAEHPCSGLPGNTGQQAGHHRLDGGSELTEGAGHAGQTFLRRRYAHRHENGA